MDLLHAFGLQVAGGIGAAAIDRNVDPKYTVHLGKSDTSPGVAITPGAMAAALAVTVLAFTGGSANGAKGVIANLAGGALVYEATKLGEAELLPRIEEMLQPDSPQSPPQVAPVMRGVYGLPQWQAPIQDWQIQNAYQAWQQVAA